MTDSPRPRVAWTRHSCYSDLIRPILPIFLSLLACFGFLRAEPHNYLSIPPQARAVDQLSHSKKSCAPAALLNSLKFGSPAHREAYASLHGAKDSDRLRYVVDRYFSRPSTHLPGVPRFTRHGGCTRQDLAAAAREAAEDFDLPELQDHEWLLRVGETPSEFVQRVHRDLRHSLKWRSPPLVEFRSQRAHWDEGKKRWEWRSMADHYVVITAVPERLKPGTLGFSIDYIDPNGGQFVSGFIHAETRQPFAGFAGEMNRGRWLGGNRFLLVTAPQSPSLIDSEEADWHTRTLIVLSYFIGA